MTWVWWGRLKLDGTGWGLQMCGVKHRHDIERDGCIQDSELWWLRCESYLVGYKSVHLKSTGNK